MSRLDESGRAPQHALVSQCSPSPHPSLASPSLAHHPLNTLSPPTHHSPTLLSLTHSLITHSLTHHSPTHSSLTHSLNTHPPTQHSPTHSSLTHSFITHRRRRMSLGDWSEAGGGQGQVGGMGFSAVHIVNHTWKSSWRWQQQLLSVCG